MLILGLKGLTTCKQSAPHLERAFRIHRRVFKILISIPLYSVFASGYFPQHFCFQNMHYLGQLYLQPTTMLNQIQPM